MSTFSVSGNDAVADLRNVRFFEPQALVRLACEAQHHAAAGRSITVHAPSDADTANYLARMGILWVLDALGATHDFMPSGVNPPNDRFVELTPIGAGLPAQIEPFWKLLIRRIKGASNDSLQRLLTSVGELEQNVIDHASTTGLMQAQHYDGAKLVRLAVGDFGPGIASRFADAGETFPNASEAILESIKPMRSTTGQPMRGYGLHYLRRDVVDVLGGTIAITSGTGRVTWKPNVPAKLEDSASFDFPGTLVEAHIPTGSMK